MEQSTLEFIYLFCAVILNLAMLIGLFTRTERRLTRIELLVKQCCGKLEIDTEHL